MIKIIYIFLNYSIYYWFYIVVIIIYVYFFFDKISVVNHEKLYLQIEKDKITFWFFMIYIIYTIQ